MVLLRGRRGFVILLWCVTPVSFDRVRRSSCVNRRPATARSGTCVRDELEWTSGVVRKRAVCHNGSVPIACARARECKKNRQSHAARLCYRSALRCLTWSEQTSADASSAEPVLAHS